MTQLNSETVLVAGASGLVGTALCERLESQGFTVKKLSHSGKAGSYAWNPKEGTMDTAALEGVDVVINLAGKNVAGRWSEAFKQELVDSRVQGTRLLAEKMAEMETKPRLYIAASAIGYYGANAPDVNEESPAGKGFMADLCVEWEAAAAAARATGIRVVHPRISLVLTAQGGALQKMLPAFKFGLGGRLGSGQQYMSWMSLGDTVSALRFLMDHEDIQGPVNLTSPDIVTNAEFTKALGAAIKRPTIFPAPAFMLKLLFGEMAEAALLADTGVVPDVLQKHGFEWKHRDLLPTLKTIL